MESCIFNECPILLKFAKEPNILPYFSLNVRTTPAIDILTSFLKQLHPAKRSFVPFLVGPSNTFIPSYLPVGVIRDAFDDSVLENLCLPMSLHLPEDVDRKITDSELDIAGKLAFSSSLKQALFLRTGHTKAASELTARQESTCWDVARLGDVSLFDTNLLLISQSNTIPLRIVVNQKMIPSVLAGRTGVPDPATFAENKILVIPYVFSLSQEANFIEMITQALNAQTKHTNIVSALQDGSLEMVMHGFAFGAKNPLALAHPREIVQKLVSPDGFLYIALRTAQNKS